MKPRVLLCATCKGTYTDPSGGALYAHACPPIPNPAYQPDASLPLYDPHETIDRPGHRDENLPPQKPLEHVEPAEPATAAADPVAASRIDLAPPKG